MSCTAELNFFRDILDKCHIGSSMLSVFDSIGSTIAPNFSGISNLFLKKDVSVQDIVGNVDGGTKYMLRNEFNFRYVCLRVPITSEKNILFIGPYLSSPVSSKEFMEICERLSISPTTQKMLKEYYSTLPIIAPHDRIFAALDAFCGCGIQ